MGISSFNRNRRLRKQGEINEKQEPKRSENEQAKCVKPGKSKSKNKNA